MCLLLNIEGGACQTDLLSGSNALRRRLTQNPDRDCHSGGDSAHEYAYHRQRCHRSPLNMVVKADRPRPICRS